MATGEGKVRKTSFFFFPGSVAFDQQANSKKTKFKKKICMFKLFKSTKFNQKERKDKNGAVSCQISVATLPSSGSQRNKVVKYCPSPKSDLRKTFI